MSIVKALALMAVAAVLTIFGATSAQAFLPYDGPRRWEEPSVTISSSDPRISDVRLSALVAEWGDAVEVTVVDGPADIELAPAASCRDESDMCGGEAHYTYTGGNYLASCSIDVLHDEDMLLTHEIGHCLGLGHRHTHESNMHWFAQDYDGGWSDLVTDEDRQRLADLYQVQP